MMTKPNKNIDDADVALLNALSKDARLTVKELAQIIGKSSAATHERIRKLEQQG